MSFIAIERRDTARQRMQYRMDVLDAKKSYFGCLLDISVTGMRVVCSEDVNILNLTKLRIELPRWLDLGDEICVEGRFVWCKATTRQRVEGGFSFDNLSDNDARVLRTLVEKLWVAAMEDGRLSEQA